MHLNSDSVSIQTSSGGWRAKTLLEAKRNRSIARDGRRKEVSLISDEPHRLTKCTLQGMKHTLPIVVQMPYTRERISQFPGMIQKDIPASFDQTSKRNVNRTAPTRLTGGIKKRKKLITKR